LYKILNNNYNKIALNSFINLYIVSFELPLFKILKTCLLNF